MQPLIKPELSTVIFTDTETWSTVDIKEAGSVKYCENADMLLAGFLMGDKYSVYDFSEPDMDVIPDWVVRHAESGGWFCAHNALFDYLVLKPHIPCLRIDQFIDLMGWCAAAGLPLGLEKAGYHLDIAEDKQKYKDGSRLVRKFCIPRKPTKLNKSTRTWPDDAPEDWTAFRDEYLRLDVYGMVDMYQRLPGLTAWEQQVWSDTQTVNLTGIPVDISTTNLIIDKLDKLVDEESSRFIRLTDLFPTQRDRVLGWVRKQGVKITNLQAATVEGVLADPETPSVVREALEARANTTHMSFKKFPKIAAAVRSDGTVGGTLMYHVAGTGRFGGRLLQPQNLTRGDIDGVEAVERIQAGEFSVPLVKSAVRPMIWHPEQMCVVDYAQVEGRGVLWVAEELDNLQAYLGDEDPYKLMAVDIYEDDYDLIDDKQRFVGKQARLGLGYQMAWKKFQMTCANYGEDVDTDTCKRAVEVFRGKHKKLVQFWEDMNGAALMAMDHLNDTVVLNQYVSFMFDGKWLRMVLPSGRCLFYYKPNVSIDSFGRSISYMSMNDKHQYARTSTYGGKLTENLVQALCRDILVHAIHNLLQEGFEVITHIHDEIVVAGTNLERVEQIMSTPPDWAHDFPLATEGEVTPRYKKI